MNDTKTKISWEASEFKMQHKSVTWYVVYAIISLGLMAYAAYTHDVLTLITFAVIIAAAYFYSSLKPNKVRYELSSTGISLNQLFYPYRNIKKFWIIYTPENRSLNFETTAYLNNQVTIELGKEDPIEVRKFLKAYLQEDLDKEENFTDVLSRKIKF